MGTGLETPPSSQKSHHDGATTEASSVPETALLLPIRVLYSLNTSPQSLLARQRRKVQVVTIPDSNEHGAGNVDGTQSSDRTVGRHRYAKVPLKICLGAVCNSSPELLADRSRDYSVYVLDPLESTTADGILAAPSSEASSTDPPLSDSIPSSSGCTGEGVSIGMGLMSWCLSEDHMAAPEGEDDDEEGYVIGKLVKDRGADALEIVMSLRETAAQTQRQHALSLSSLGFHPPGTPSQADYSSSGVAQFSSSVPSSPKSCAMSSLPRSSEISAIDTNFSRESVPESDEASMLQVVSPLSAPDSNPRSSSSYLQTSTIQLTATRVGRPPGALTHPEKRARRLAIQSHKEMLERMENIARMQKGEPYDQTLIRVSDHATPQVTDEEIARQRKVLEELESRPLIVDQASNWLTKKPLPKRTKTSTSIVPLAKKSSTRRKPRSASPANAIASNSTTQNNDATRDDRSMNVVTDSVVQNKHGAELLLSLLTSVLGKVDGPPAAHPTIHESEKGKEKETPLPTEGGLADALKELLPLLPNAASQSTPLVPSVAHASAASSGFRAHQLNISDGLRPQASTPLARNRALFKTAEETFDKPQPRPNWPYNQHWAAYRTVPTTYEHPKVREDAHPVPGGGWARGRNLVPRASSSAEPLPPSRPNWQTGYAAGDTASTATTNSEAQPDKENIPPTKLGRGLKRTLSAVADSKEKGEGVSAKSTGKKRKQETTPALSSDKTTSVSTKRIVMGSTERNRTNTSGVSGFTVTVSSPVRSTASTRGARSLPVMAMSEPDYLSPPLPIVATSTSPDLIIKPPRTPPRRKNSSDDDADSSLFTPRPESTPQFRGANVPLYSPSPARANSRGGHVEDPTSVATVPGGNSECSGTGSKSQSVRTGWDLPPSSPPPPTSPISPHAEIGSEQEDHIVFELSGQSQSGLDVEMEKSGTDGRFEDDNTINGVGISGVSPHVAGDLASMTSHSPFTPVSSSDFDLLSDANFDFGELGQVQGEPGGDEGIQLDIEELWSSLGPVIAQAQTDSSIMANNQTSSQVEADFSYFDLGNDQSHAEVEVQSEVDAVKLAEDLKALFGGCVV